MSFGRVACGRCGVRNHARQVEGYLCGTCRPMMRIQPTEADALKGGCWVRDGLIMRWQADPEPDHCGTERGHSRHRRAGEFVCDECREAHRLYIREYRQRKAA